MFIFSLCQIPNNFTDIKTYIQFADTLTSEFLVHSLNQSINTYSSVIFTELLKKKKKISKNRIFRGNKQILDYRWTGLLS